jgi:hypothetical protein
MKSLNSADIHIQDYKDKNLLLQQDVTSLQLRLGDIYLCIYLYIYVSLSIDLYVPFAYLSIYPSIYLSIYTADAEVTLETSYAKEAALVKEKEEL